MMEIIKKMNKIGLSREGWHKVYKNVFVKLYKKNEDNCIDELCNFDKKCVNLNEEAEVCGNTADFALGEMHCYSDILRLRPMCGKCCWIELNKILENNTSHDTLSLAESIEDEEKREYHLDVIQASINFAEINMVKVYEYLEAHNPDFLKSFEAGKAEKEVSNEF